MVRLKLRILSVALLMLGVSAQWVLADNLLTLADFRRASENQSVLVTHPFYPDSVWSSWINEACSDLASYGVIEKLDTLEWTIGTMIYDLNDDFIQLLALFPLRFTDQKEALNFIPARDVGKMRMTGLATKDFWQSGKGRDAIVGFYPVPTVKDTFMVIYGAEANYLSSDNDTTDIPYSYRPLIVDWVVYRALMRDGKESTSDRYYESYMKRLEVKLRFNQKRFDVLIIPKEIKNQ